MKSLAQHVSEYLMMRRSLGFKAEREKWHLFAFVAFLKTQRVRHIKTALVVAWAKQPADAHPGYWAGKFGVVRGFAKYVHLIDSRHEVPSPGLLGRHPRRTTPAIYTEKEVVRILHAARERTFLRHQKKAPFKGLTHEVLFGLLAATGMRVGEAIRLDDSDIDWAGGVLVIRESKFRKSREVPVHDTVLDVLRSYREARDRQIPRRHTKSFFASLAGTRLIYNNVHTTFRQLLKSAGIERRRARVHDLRHTFVVRTVLRWYREGANVDACMPILSTYLGHRSPASTYWYLTATPELMAVVGRKLARAIGAMA
ncbi:MAG TPA: tyrosine-type recombinase/integrase [Labilithrix sp.]|nr:tyrosine-type recombinase/integrase [Labilithrix sp.]